MGRTGACIVNFLNNRTGELMKRILFIMLFLALVPAHAQESFWTGMTLKQKLNSNVTLDRIEALAYTLGVHDASSMAGVVCSPDNIKAGQIREVVGLYLIFHPAILHRSAGELATLALVEPWPCPGMDPSARPRPRPGRTF